MNLVYVHISSRLHHDDECKSKCSAVCDVAKFHAELESPLLDFEARQEERLKERFTLLISGEIPA